MRYLKSLSHADTHSYVGICKYSSIYIKEKRGVKETVGDLLITGTLGLLIYQLWNIS